MKRFMPVGILLIAVGIGTCVQYAITSTVTVDNVMSLIGSAVLGYIIGYHSSKRLHSKESID